MVDNLVSTQAAPINISFTEIPANLAVPGAWMEVAANFNKAGLVAYPARALLLVPIGTAGTLVALTPTQVFSAAQGAALCGKGTVGAAMIAAFIAANPWTPLYVMGLATPGGATASVWTIDCSIGTSLTGDPGTLALYVGAVKVAITVTPGVDTGGAIATALAAAVNATPGLPVTASVSSTTNVLLTARDKGAFTSALDVRFNLNVNDAYPGGLTTGSPNYAPGISLTAGTGVHAVGTALAAIPNFWATDISMPWTDSTSIGALSTELDRRFNAMVGLDAAAYLAVTKTSLSALLSVTSSLNSKFLVLAGLQNGPTAPWVLSATLCAVAAFRTANDPARQCRGAILPGIVAPASVDVLYESERQSMLTGGMATVIFDQGGTCTIERLVTTYQTAAGGIPDTQWRDLNTMKVVSRVRYDWNAYVALAWPDRKMAADGTLAAEYDEQIATPRRLHSSWAGRCRLYEQLGWIQNSQASVAASVFQLDASDPNRMNARMQIQVVNNLIVLAGRLEFSQFADTTTGVSTTAQG